MVFLGTEQHQRIFFKVRKQILQSLFLF